MCLIVSFIEVFIMILFLHMHLFILNCSKPEICSWIILHIRVLDMLKQVGDGKISAVLCFGLFVLAFRFLIVLEFGGL